MEETVIVRTESEPRRFRVLEVRSRDGGGARLVARPEVPPETALVWVELLDDPSPARLARLRDEAKMLRGLSGRQVAVIEGPLRLAGQWATLREHRGGRDLATLLRRSGPLPAPAALEVVAALARTLEVLWRRTRPDGRPLHLLHRNLCPASVEVDPDGNVRLCGFSLARASLEQPESDLERLDPGPKGYVAPERLEGQEDPRGDVFSLGVLLEELVTGVSPLVDDADAPTVLSVGRTPAPLLDLCARMRAPDPRDRPSALEVAERALSLASTLWGGSLASWAAEHVRPDPDRAPDPLDGALLVEGEEPPRPGEVATAAVAPPAPAAEPAPDDDEEGVRSPVTMVLVGGVAAIAGGIGAIGVGLLVIAVVVGGRLLAAPPELARPAPPLPDPPEVVVAAPPLPVEPPEPPEAPEPGPVAPEPAEPVPAAVAPAPVGVAPEPARPPRPAPAAAPPVAPEPAPAGDPRGTVHFQGADAILMVGDAGQFGPGAVPAGQYVVLATWDGQQVPAGRVVVEGGAELSLHCDPAFLRCRVRR